MSSSGVFGVEQSASAMTSHPTSDLVPVLLVLHLPSCVSDLSNISFKFLFRALVQFTCSSRHYRYCFRFEITFGDVSNPFFFNESLVLCLVLDFIYVVVNITEVKRRIFELLKRFLVLYLVPDVFSIISDRTSQYSRYAKSRKRSQCFIVFQMFEALFRI